MAAHPARVVSAPWVVPIAGPPIEQGAVVLDGQDEIVAIGARAQLRRQFGDLPEQRGEGALLPGLINAHVHLELSALAGLVPGGDGLVPWASNVVRRGSSISPDERRLAAIRAAKEAVATGTAAIGDVSNGLGAVAALAEAGLRGLVFHEILGSREARTGDALADAERERQALVAVTPWPEGVGYVVAPHAPYSAGPDLLGRIFAAATRSGHPTSVHVAEDGEEIALLRTGTGRWAPILAAMGVMSGSRTPGEGPLPYLAGLGAFETRRPPLLVHMVHASEEDLALARRFNAPIVLCPRSNAHIGGRLADVRAFQTAGLRLALGTDSLASAPSLSLWGEIATLAHHFSDIKPEVWLGAATVGGANALGLSRLGSLEPGKRPGILDVALDDAQLPLACLVRNDTPRLHWMARA